VEKCFSLLQPMNHSLNEAMVYLLSMILVVSASHHEYYPVLTQAVNLITWCQHELHCVNNEQCSYGILIVRYAHIHPTHQHAHMHTHTHDPHTQHTHNTHTHTRTQLHCSRSCNAECPCQLCGLPGLSACPHGGWEIPPCCTHHTNCLEIPSAQSKSAEEEYASTEVTSVTVTGVPLISVAGDMQDSGQHW